jgi:hypothetical protein
MFNFLLMVSHFLCKAHFVDQRYLVLSLIIAHLIYHVTYPLLLLNYIFLLIVPLTTLNCRSNIFGE